MYCLACTTSLFEAYALQNSMSTGNLNIVRNQTKILLNVCKVQDTSAVMWMYLPNVDSHKIKRVILEVKTTSLVICCQIWKKLKFYPVEYEVEMHLSLLEKWQCRSKSSLWNQTFYSTNFNIWQKTSTYAVHIPPTQM